MLLGGAEPAAAATFTVTKEADTNDGLCDADCSLREAIIAANALAGPDTINLPAGTYTLSIAGVGEDAAATGDLDITDDLTITGAHQATTIIDGAALDRVFQVPSAATVDIAGVTVSNGSAGNGGGIFNQGDGALTLTDTTVSGNTASVGGGGIFNQRGVLTLTDSTVSSNTAARGGGVFNASFFDSDSSLLIRTTISDNTATDKGGGIFNAGGTSETVFALTDSIVSGNTAVLGDVFNPSEGGGIYDDSNGALTLVRSTVTGNAANDGAGIFKLSIGTLKLTDSVVTANTASGAGVAFGGGIHVAISGTIGVTIQNSTISSNMADSGGGIFFQSRGGLTLGNSTISDNSGGGIRQAFSGTVTLKNSIVADGCAGVTITSLGHNLDSDGSCGLSEPGDISGVDPLLGPLADNGGPTLTHALLPGSPAIDAVPVSDCTDAAGNPVTTDQRGVSRPQGAACDIGAYEAGDLDGDGVPDDEDKCPDSNLSPTVVIDGCDTGVENQLFNDGCTISDLIDKCAADAGNHGRFVSCVAKFANGLKKAGIVSGREKGKIQSCAARSDIP